MKLKQTLTTGGKANPGQCPRHCRDGKGKQKRGEKVLIYSTLSPQFLKTKGTMLNDKRMERFNRQ